MAIHHREGHRTQHIGWLRAAVLGANDGIVSTASLLVGVAAAHGGKSQVMIAGIAGLAAGAMSMAAGEYVSVSSQADIEQADIKRERAELESSFPQELDELTGIYKARGLDQTLARQVAEQLMAKDALGAHMRDELGITDTVSARPIQAAFTSAASFACGAILPLLTALLMPPSWMIAGVSGCSLIVLWVLGTMAAFTGGANKLGGALRVTFWGAFAMALTAGVGALFGIFM
jgi:VIT1/CCC1 family predicted Fe2+/Mn2+ transporter